MSELNTGLQGAITWTVTEAMTAATVGSGGVAVFSTPMLVALMESAAMEALSNELPEGDTTVGTQIDVKHLSATPVGDTVRAKATLVEVDGRKLTFKVEAWDHVELIGEATHTRFIVNQERFEAKVAQKSA